ncbi:MAG: hypothetical protein FJ333_11600, partial [Sphingomonadales bacterium]|nr:hypothetical protein [Sphingomonadales bacterium]
MSFEIYDIRFAKISLLSSCNQWFSAFPTKIVFGKVKNSIYLEGMSFIFQKSDFIKLYLSIQTIVSSIAKNEEYPNGLILKKGNVSYKLNLSLNAGKKVITFISEINEQITYEIQLDLEDLNDFVNIISKLILPTVSVTKEVQILLE